MDMPNIHLDSDGTEVDDEDYFQTLEPNTELIAVFSGEQWIDVSVAFVLIYYASVKIGPRHYVVTDCMCLCDAFFNTTQLLGTLKC